MASNELSKRNNSHPWFTFHDQFSDLINRFTDDFGYPSQSTISHFVPKVDVQDLKDKYLVTAEIPGMKEEEINIDLVDNVLTLEGEKRSEFSEQKEGWNRSEISYGKFYRTIPLKDEVDEEKCDAQYKDGVLKVTLSKKADSEKRSRRISVNQSKASAQGRH